MEIRYIIIDGQTTIKGSFKGKSNEALKSIMMNFGFIKKSNQILKEIGRTKRAEITIHERGRR